MKRKHLKNKTGESLEKKPKVEREEGMLHTENVQQFSESNDDKEIDLSVTKRKKKKKGKEKENKKTKLKETLEDSAVISTQEHVLSKKGNIVTKQSDKNEIEKINEDVTSHEVNSSEKVEDKSNSKKKKKRDKQQENIANTRDSCKSDKKEIVHVTSEQEDSGSCETEKKAVKKKKKTKDRNIQDTDGDNSNKEPGNEKSAKDLAIEYLNQWKKHRDVWKFQKVRQVWLLNHMYKQDMVKDKHFMTFLSYLDGMKGKSRETTSNDAQKIIESDSDDEVKLDRARQIVQQLSTD